MKLHPPHGMLAVAKGMDLIGITLRRRRDAQLRRQRPALDDQGMVAPDLERIGNAGEEVTPVMRHARCLAVHGARRTYHPAAVRLADRLVPEAEDRKSTRLNSSHPSISYAVFCLKKKTKQQKKSQRPPRHQC